MALYGVSLNSVTSVGEGSAIVFDTPKSLVTLVAVCNGVDAAGVGTQVQLEYSVDGVTFVAGPVLMFPYVCAKSVSLTGFAVMAVRASVVRYDVNTTSITASLAAI